MSSKSSRAGTYAFGAVEQALRASLRKRARLGSAGSAKRSSRMRVGFIGLDPTGMAMASRLLKAGHRITLYDPRREIPETLESAGARVANSIQDACRWADAVFTMLPNDEITEAVILDPGGVVESLPRKAIHIGSSTVSVECSDRIVEAHWDSGKQYVSAPVLVRSESTSKMQLLVIAAGREETIFQIEPLFSPIGQLAQVSGWPSDANLVQLGARHPELRARQDRLQLASLAFLDIETNLDIETKGVLQ